MTMATKTTAATSSTNATTMAAAIAAESETARFNSLTLNFLIKYPDYIRFDFLPFIEEIHALSFSDKCKIFDQLFDSKESGSKYLSFLIESEGNSNLLTVLIVLLKSNNVTKEQIGLQIEAAYGYVSEEILFLFIIKNCCKDIEKPTSPEEQNEYNEIESLFKAALEAEKEGRTEDTTCICTSLIDKGDALSILKMAEMELRKGNFSQAKDLYGDAFLGEFIREINLAKKLKTLMFLEKYCHPVASDSETIAKGKRHIMQLVVNIYKYIASYPGVDGFNIYASFHLAKCNYYQSLHILFEQKIYRQILSSLNKAAKQNISHALLIIGQIYQNGLPETVEFDIAKAIEYFKKAVEAGNMSANYYLGKLYSKFGEYKLALESFLKLVDHKHPLAKKIYFDIGWLYEKGFGGAEQIGLAQKYYDLHSQPGTENVDSLFKLGVIAFKSENYQEAKKIFEQIIELKLNHGRALNNLGFMYAQGLGVNKDLQEAENFFNLAVNRSGLPEAMHNLALIHKNSQAKTELNQMAIAFGIKESEDFIFVTEQPLTPYLWQGYLPGTGVVKFELKLKPVSTNTSGDCFFAALNAKRGDVISELLKQIGNSEIVDLIAKEIFQKLTSEVDIKQFDGAPNHEDLMRFVDSYKENEEVLQTIAFSLDDKFTKFPDYPQSTEDKPKYIADHLNVLSEEEAKYFQSAFVVYQESKRKLEEAIKSPIILSWYVKKFLSGEKREWISVSETTGILDAIAHVLGITIRIWEVRDAREQRIRLNHISPNSSIVEVDILLNHDHYEKLEPLTEELTLQALNDRKGKQNDIEHLVSSLAKSYSNTNESSSSKNSPLPASAACCSYSNTNESLPSNDSPLPARAACAEEYDTSAENLEKLLIPDDSDDDNIAKSVFKPGAYDDLRSRFEIVINPNKRTRDGCCQESLPNKRPRANDEFNGTRGTSSSFFDDNRYNSDLQAAINASQAQAQASSTEEDDPELQAAIRASLQFK